jgi:hypothetical protein
LSTDAVIQALKDAQWLALTTLGVNFTGGEIFTGGSPILELLSAAQEMGIPARANTNATWGGCRSIKIGTHEFANDEDVVAALSQRQLGRLALSLDNRYDQYPHLLDRVIRVAVLCEAAQLTYEVVCTDPRAEIRDLAWGKLTATLGHEPQYLLITPMEKVDVGGPARFNNHHLEAHGLVELAQNSPCATQGFYRPYFLHVAPHGGIRSCMNAPNGGWHGNITQQRLPEILNNAARNPVSQLFASDNLASFIETHLVPWQHLYKNINHGCTAAAVIARIAEEAHAHQTSLGRPLNPEEMAVLHQRISQEYRLAIRES